MNSFKIINPTNSETAMYKISPVKFLFLFFEINTPLLTLRPRLLLTRKGSMTLKCLETKGCPWFSGPPGKTA